MSTGINFNKAEVGVDRGSMTGWSDSVSSGLKGAEKTMEMLISEGGESFYYYVDWMGLARDPEMIVLSSDQHYYFNEDEIEKVNTVVNLKQLNQIRNLDVLLSTIFRIMKPKSNFVGCFAEKSRYLEPQNNIKHKSADSESAREAIDNGIVSRSRFMNRLYNFVDLRTNRYMKRENVRKLLQDHGFKVLDMTDLNGITYFCARKTLSAGE